MSDVSRPHLIWDGECGFCKRWVDHWRELTQGNVEYIAYQDAPDLLAAHDIDEIETAQAVHLIMPDGRVFRGAAAVVETLRHAPEPRYRLYRDAYRHLPGLSDVMEGVYRFVAGRRALAARLTRWLWGRPHRETFSMAQFLFTRALAVATFFAFFSLLQQSAGLFGPHGILPFADFTAQATEWGREVGRNPHLVFPSVFWWLGAGDETLHAAAMVGMGASAALFVGLAPRLMVAVSWALYLSFMSLDQLFLGYQWDALLLETLFVGFFFVPGGWRPSRTLRSQPGGRWLVWLLLAKLMLMAGYVKLAVADSAWTDLSALQYHFWTQPIPNLVSPYAASLPQWALSVGVVFTLLVEMFVPLLIFAPRRLRHIGAILMIVLQVMIVVTGTYGFFNLLAIALCLALFDDHYFGRSAITATTDERSAVSYGALVVGSVIVSSVVVFAPEQFQYIIARALTLLVPMALVLAAISGFRSDNRRVVLELRAVALAVTIPLVVLTTVLPNETRTLVSPLRTFNQYGLFASMTKTRPEIIVEWSADGRAWTAYDFEYKPTDTDEPLRPSTFIMPRLDWQMWFAALRGCQSATWLRPFAQRLLMSTPEVEALLEGNLPQSPPKFLRMRAFDYEFDAGGWKREGGELFCPTGFSLSDTGAVIRSEPPPE